MKNVSNPVFKRTTVDFDEELLVIKQQLLDEDNKQEGENSLPEVTKKMKVNTNAESSEKKNKNQRKRNQTKMEKLA